MTVLDLLEKARRLSIDVSADAYPHGIRHVLVNDALVVENGKHTGARPGRVLRKT